MCLFRYVLHITHVNITHIHTHMDAHTHTCAHPHITRDGSIPTLEDTLGEELRSVHETVVTLVEQQVMIQLIASATMTHHTPLDRGRVQIP